MYRRFVVLSILMLTGCSGSVAPVSGVITLDGKPLKGAMVVFEPVGDSKEPGPSSTGKTDASGKYSLQLASGGNGAVRGKHKVSITAYEGDDAEVESSAPTAKSVFRKALLSEEYNSKSTLTFEVPGGGTDSANFDLKSAGNPAGK